MFTWTVHLFNQIHFYNSDPYDPYHDPDQWLPQKLRNIALELLRLMSAAEKCNNLLLVEQYLWHEINYSKLNIIFFRSSDTNIQLNHQAIIMCAVCGESVTRRCHYKCTLVSTIFKF